MSLLPGCTASYWQQLPSLPDAEGFASPFAGTSNGVLIVAGGANFPDKRPWEKGTKHWYDAAFVLEKPDGRWKTGQTLPRPVAYGVSVSTPDGVVCIGGGDAKAHFCSVYRLTWNGNGLTTSELPKLPKGCAFMSGALVSNTIYISGGIETPDATSCLKTLWALDLKTADPRWQELPGCPGPERMLAIAGAADGSYFLFSGTRLTAGPDGKPVREYLRDAWRYSPGSGWKKLADLPRAAVAAASPAPIASDGKLLVVSGDDGLNVGFKPETQHPGFARSVIGYDIAADRWSEEPDAPFSRATVPTAVWRGRTVIPSGEARPGYRSAEVWSLPASR